MNLSVSAKHSFQQLALKHEFSLLQINFNSNIQSHFFEMLGFNNCKCFIHLLISSIFISSACSSNILFFHLVASASHRNAIWPLAEKLADSGHNVTYIFPMSNRMGAHPKIEEIKPSKLIPAVDIYIKEVDINLRLNNTVETWEAQGFLTMSKFCEAFYDSSETQEWLARPLLHYDLILIDASFGHCSYGLVHKFGAKHILFLPITIGSFWDPFGLVPESSSIPEFVFHRDPATMATCLWSRTLGTISPFLFRVIWIYNMRQFEGIAREKLGLGEEMPSFDQIERETSLVLVNTYFIEDYPMALPPMFVSYSGLSCTKSVIQKRKALPKKLAAFIEDEGSEGFVYVSFGSTTDMSTMPEKLRNEFFKTFAAFPNLKFLWRWGRANESVVNLPENLFVQKWFPQLEILAHPKIKAFITQAGRPSTQEAICRGVPMIAIPIIADQDFNAQRLEHIGAAVVLDIASLTTEKLVGAICKIIDTDTYKIRLQELSAMFRERPLDSLENAHFWVEYVLKYNTSLLKPLGMNQTWWQRRLLDVYLFLLLIVLTLVGIMIFIAVSLFRFIILPLMRFIINFIINGVGAKLRKKEKMK